MNKVEIFPQTEIITIIRISYLNHFYRVKEKIRTSLPFFSSLEVMKMSPSHASARPSAIARPIPRFDPVTTATYQIFFYYSIILLVDVYMRLICVYTLLTL